MSTPKQNKFYITTSIAYANAGPHIGHALEACQADVLARYHRMKSDDVFFLSGTDENGSKIKKTALEKKMDPQKFVDENSAKFQLLLDTLNISNNDFIRTTDKVRHWPAAQKIWNELVKKGDIYKSSYEGYYCVGCEAYLTEKDLVDGKCSNHQKAPEKIKEENYFFKLSKYSKMIQEKIESGELEILPESRKNEILNVIKDGLKDISFSRPKKTLDWGVPVPNDETQTMYVWCDALTNYISALGYGNNNNNDNISKNLTCHSREGGNPLPPQPVNPALDVKIKNNKINNATNFQKYWSADIHLIGKDILRFHAAIWPAMLLSAGLPLPKKIFVHGFITSGGQKMSKSLGNVIDPFEVVDKYGVDALRYYLLKEIPSGGDGDFSFERFEEVYQADLANGIGNLVYRVLTMIERNFDNKIPESKKEALVPFEIIEKAVFKNCGSPVVKEPWQINIAVNRISKSHINKFRLNNILQEVLVQNTALLDIYIDYYKPFKLIKEDKELTASVLYNCAETIRIIAWMIWPFMPETANKIFAQLFADEQERKKELNKTLTEAQKWGGLKPGMKIKKGKILFPRL